jgi:hypothetical protein
MARMRSNAKCECARVCERGETQDCVMSACQCDLTLMQ